MSVAIGVTPEERARPRPIELDVVVQTELELEEDGTLQDRLEHTVDYGAIHRLVCEVAGGASWQLLETLALRVRAELLERFPGVVAAEIRCAKPAPPLPGEVASAEVVIPAGRGSP